jgi:hypothetical protein
LREFADCWPAAARGALAASGIEKERRVGERALVAIVEGRLPLIWRPRVRLCPTPSPHQRMASHTHTPTAKGRGGGR